MTTVLVAVGLVWLGLAVLTVALCVAAGRADRAAEVAEAEARVPRARPLASPRRLRAASTGQRSGRFTRADVPERDLARRAPLS